MGITKTATDRLNMRRNLYMFESARNAFEHILNYYKAKEDFTLLLPGYIGFSAYEGSGIYDPVINTRCKYVFYPMNRKLNIKLDDFKSLLQSVSGPKVVLLVHYFGFPDINIKEVVQLCRDSSAEIIEDAAHAMYSDFVDKSCGMYGDFVFYSYHKMLPYSSGGGLKINTNIQSDFTSGLQVCTNIFEYDINLIAQKRKTNALLWEDMLKDKTPHIELFRSLNNVTPQTYPIIIHGYDRNELYFKLNDASYGAVSLYHTMIRPIQDSSVLQDSCWLSQHIINMPVHQDVEIEDIYAMSQYLFSLLK